MTTENNAKVLISKYRRRKRDIWSNEEKRDNFMFYEKKTSFSVGFETIDSFINDNMNNILSPIQIVNAIAISSYSHDLTDMLLHLQKQLYLPSKNQTKSLFLIVNIIISILI